ncbi:MAG: methyltransferase domain-containing protein [Ktedonobacterales bacterium]
MPQKFDTRKKYLLISDERRAILKPDELLRELGLRAGDTFADIGSGPGFFTLPAAEIVGEQGHVFAADIQGEMLTAVKSRATEAGLTNVRVVKTSETEIPLPPDSCDMAFLAFVLHELGSHAIFLHRAARIIKPNGKLVVMEWEKHETGVGPPVEDRITPDELVADAEAAGLHVEDRRQLTDDQYLFIFTRT